jgi:hypothetical protein
MFQNSVNDYNGYIKSEVVIKKEWLASPDSCEVCKANMAAGAIPLKDKFPSGHLFPPASVYCRCCLQPVTKDI